MRALTFSLGCLCLALSLSGCRPSDPEPAARRIVCSTFPLWLLTRNIADGQKGVSVELLLPAGLGCPHEYVVTPEDARRIESADVMVINGLGLDDFAADRFRQSKPNGPVIIATEGLQSQEHSAHSDGEHGHSDTTPHEHDHGLEANPHLFSSPRLAARMAQRIAGELARIDPDGAARYESNAARLAQRLDALADEIRKAIEVLPNKRIIAQHDILDAFATDAGLEIVGYIQAHAGHDPSAQEIIELVRTVRQRDAGAVFVEPQYPARIGETIAREAGIPIGTVDPVASGPDDAPMDYYEITMRRNVEELRKVLSSPHARPGT